MKNFIKQKTETIAVNKTTHYFMAAFVFAAALFYMFFANIAVRTLASLEKAKEETQNLSIEVSEMESKRLSMENSVNTKLAAQLGFVEAGNPTFIVKSAKKAALSFKTN